MQTIGIYELLAEVQLLACLGSHGFAELCAGLCDPDSNTAAEDLCPGHVTEVPGGFPAGMSYRKAEWVPEADVMQAKPQLLRNFMQRRYAGLQLSYFAAQCHPYRGISVRCAPVNMRMSRAAPEGAHS